MDDIFIRYIKLPYKIPAFTILDDNGDYNIYINTEVCPDKQRAAYMHEMYHITHNHFYDNLDLESDEFEATNAETNIRYKFNWG